MRLTKLAAAALIAVTAGMSAGTGAAARAGATSPLPIPPYTAAQAAQGETAFENDCAQCHGANLEGYSGPALTGKQFTETYASLSVLLGFISKSMPFDAPGSLTHQDYVAIVAFILSKNGVAPGAAPLTYQGAMASKATVWKPGQ